MNLRVALNRRWLEFFFFERTLRLLCCNSGQKLEIDKWLSISSISLWKYGMHVGQDNLFLLPSTSLRLFLPQLQYNAKWNVDVKLKSHLQKHRDIWMNLLFNFFPYIFDILNDVWVFNGFFFHRIQFFPRYLAHFTFISFILLSLFLFQFLWFVFPSSLLLLFLISYIGGMEYSTRQNGNVQ